MLLRIEQWKQDAAPGRSFWCRPNYRELQRFSTATDPNFCMALMNQASNTEKEKDGKVPSDV